MRIILCLLTVMVSVCACHVPRYAYSPSAVNVPVLTKKGDSKLGALYSSNGNGNLLDEAFPTQNQSRGVDAQAAYAITDHFAIQAAYFNRFERNGDEQTASTQEKLLLKYKRNLTEFGLGYYVPLDKEKLFWFQVFGGAGFGKFQINENRVDSVGSYDRFHYSNVTKFYIQPAFVLNAGRVVRFSFSSRFSLVKFNQVKTNYNSDELAGYYLSELPTTTFGFWEPAFTNSYAFTKLKGITFELQVGKSFRLNKTIIEAKTSNYSIGAFFDIPLLFSKKSD